MLHVERHRDSADFRQSKACSYMLRGIIELNGNLVASRNPLSNERISRLIYKPIEPFVGVFLANTLPALKRQKKMISTFTNKLLPHNTQILITYDGGHRDYFPSPIAFHRTGNPLWAGSPQFKHTSDVLRSA